MISLYINIYRFDQVKRKFYFSKIDCAQAERVIVNEIEENVCQMFGHSIDISQVFDIFFRIVSSVFEAGIKISLKFSESDKFACHLQLNI